MRPSRSGRQLLGLDGPWAVAVEVNICARAEHQLDRSPTIFAAIAASVAGGQCALAAEATPT